MRVFRFRVSENLLLLQAWSIGSTEGPENRPLVGYGTVESLIAF